MDDFPEDIEDNTKEATDIPQAQAGGRHEIHIPINLTKVYSFRSLREVTKLANVLLGTYYGNNTLYKDPVTSTYYLVINISKHTPEEFNKISNIISEYGKPERSNYATQVYFDEHHEVIVKDQAIQILSVM